MENLYSKDQKNQIEKLKENGQKSNGIKEIFKCIFLLMLTDVYNGGMWEDARQKNYMMRSMSQC